MLDLKQIIIDSFDSFSWTQKSIATAILNNFDVLSNFSVIQLATCANVSPAMVIKFAKFLHLSGFEEMKFLAKYHETNFYPNITTITNTLYQTQVENQSLFDKVAKRLKESKTIFIFAFANSANAAFDFYYKCSKIRKNVFMFTEFTEQQQRFLTLDATDLVLLVSNSGNAKELVQLLSKFDPTFAKKEQIILFTNHNKGKLAKHATLTLTGKSFDKNKEYAQYLPYSSKYSLMYMLDEVFLSYFNTYHDEAQKNLEKWKYHIE